MTGHGQSQVQLDTISIDCEIKAVNNRFLKCNVYWHDQFSIYETALQNLMRQYVRRGTVTVNIHLQSTSCFASYSLNSEQLKKYMHELKAIELDWDCSLQANINTLLTLPGVVTETSEKMIDVESVWPSVEQAVIAALVNLNAMRAQEGSAMARDIRSHLESIDGLIEKVNQRAPSVVADYSQRLLDKINELLRPLSTQVTNAELVKEVGIFAERSDISEEIVRLRSHLVQFRTSIDSGKADGRKLEFLTQELLREANTIGSKANDAQISNCVVEIKMAIERIREMVQNIE